ncbi:MAG: aromatic ring-hydroxylating dioxygenase subunit alpha, partial [Chloroflexota bacterium]|nr:aromatic ring-hydroxylating dioxygenase subunit alpha [Chloroflexota bacterium]
MTLTADQMELMQGAASPLTREANELICLTGPGTPMGDTVRRYWVPALLSTELPEPDGAPVEVRLLGEDLVAFRDT